MARDVPQVVVLQTLAALEAENPRAYAALIVALRDHPRFGSVTIRFQSGRLQLVDRQESFH